MNVMVNGVNEELQPSITISEYLTCKAIDTKLVVVEWNFTMLPREAWNQLQISEGDNLEIIKIIGGG
ncbi:MAG TPA: sulfur carrier protein ThiS [Bacillota bacterium]|jgi:sulfur carrier protein|nr:sulfur carrier protein ThiS [Bacillota bacterium]